MQARDQDEFGLDGEEGAGADGADGAGADGEQKRGGSGLPWEGSDRDYTYEELLGMCWWLMHVLHCCRGWESGLMCLAGMAGRGLWKHI